MDEDLKILQGEMGSQKFAIALAMDTLNIIGHQDCYLATASQGHLLFWKNAQTAPPPPHGYVFPL